MNKTHALAMVLLCLCWPSIGCVRQSPDAAPLDLTRTKQCVPDQVEESAATSSSFFVSVKYHDKNHNKIVIKDGMAVAIKKFGQKVLLLTCKHLMDDAEEIIVRSWRGKRVVPATLLARSPTSDAALLSVNDIGPEVKISTISSRHLVQFGLPVSALGGINSTSTSFISERYQLFVKGYLAGEAELKTEGNLWLADIYVSPGFSGGGIFDAQQHLIGIITGKMGADTDRNLSFILPLARIQPWLEEVFKKYNAYL